DISVSGSLPVTLASALVLTVSGAAMGLGYGVGTHVPARLLGWVSAVAAGSAVIAHALSGLSMERVWAVAAASLAVGMAAVVLARRLRAPALLFVMAGVIPLVPGSRIYRGLLGLGDDVVAGA